jgi:hypothetical protein
MLTEKTSLAITNTELPQPGREAPGIRLTIVNHETEPGAKTKIPQATSRPGKSQAINKQRLPKGGRQISLAGNARPHPPDFPAD